MPIADPRGAEGLQALWRIGAHTCLAGDNHRRIPSKHLGDREVCTSEACPINRFAGGKLAERVNKAMGIGNRISKRLRLSRDRVSAILVKVEDRSTGTSGCVFRIEIEVRLLRDGSGPAKQYRIKDGYLVWPDRSG